MSDEAALVAAGATASFARDHFEQRQPAAAAPDADGAAQPGAVRELATVDMCPQLSVLNDGAPVSPQQSAWLTPSLLALSTEQTSFFANSPGCRSASGRASTPGDATDGPDVLAIRSQSSHSSLPPSSALLGEPEAVEPVWPIDRELKETIIQTLIDEQHTPIDADYMQYHGRDVQQDGDWITPSMRFMTITWMSEAIDDLHLSQGVCCMSITLLDRYLSSARAFPRSMLQLAAGTCMFVAAKIEGVLPHPPASAFVALAAGAFELDDIVLFERILCQTLSFNLCAPTVHNFLTLFESTLDDAHEELVAFLREHVHHMACFLLELTLCSFEMLRTPRHVLAVAALVLAYTDRGLLRHVAEAGDLSFEAVEGFALDCVASFRRYFGPDVHVNAVAQCCGEMLRLLRVSAATAEEPFVVQKFRLPKYCCVARLSAPTSTDDFRRAMLAYVGQAF